MIFLIMAEYYFLFSFIFEFMDDSFVSVLETAFLLALFDFRSIFGLLKNS